MRAGVIDNIVENLLSESALLGAKVRLKPNYDLPDGFPPITFVAATSSNVELYIVIDLANSERPYVELLKAFCSLYRAEQYLQQHGESRTVEMRIECAHAPFRSVNDLFADRQFKALCDRYFPTKMNNAPANRIARR